MEDISVRALRVLSEVAVVAAEDTRRTRALLSRHGLAQRLVTLEEHNEEQQAPALVERLAAGESIALVSDAGTPVLSDPGFRLIRMAAEAGIEIVSVPGPSAITAALSISGLPTDRFCFEGFLPARPAARRRRLEGLCSEERTLVLFESSHRIADCLQDLVAVFGPDREAAVCREMTKRFETVLRGSLASIAGKIAEEPEQRRGEFVLVVQGGPAARPEAFAEALELAQELQAHLPASQAVRIAARLRDVSRRELYRALEETRQ
jgi:16S rRNA (cytidine1402-2'-O)-methyltransferase